MNRIWQQTQRARLTGLLPALVITLTLVIFAGALWLVSQDMRRKTRAQIASRDGEILHEISLMQMSEPPDEDFDASMDSPASQVSFLLKISRLPRLKDAMAIRLFDVAGKFVDAFPAYVTESNLSEEDLPSLKRLRPVSHFYAQRRLSENFLQIPKSDTHGERSIPILEIVIPIHAKNDSRLLGVAQYVLEGQNIANEFAALDRNLCLQAAVTFSLGGVIIAVVLGWAFHRLQRSNRLLAERTAELLGANHELTLAAKTSALGAVTAHLIHGLKNPLFGLECFMATRSQEADPESTSDWQFVLSTTHHMQTMLSEVVRLMKEENGAIGYEISLDELTTIISSKTLPIARQAGIHYTIELNAEGTLSNREANLVILILDILLKNALQATPIGKKVKLIVCPSEDSILCEVQDEGPGLRAELLDSLFKPCQSRKKDGNGIGLAIAKQLASHIGAELGLKRSSPNGCAFTLSLPEKLTRKRSPLAAEVLAGLN